MYNSTDRLWATEQTYNGPKKLIFSPSDGQSAFRLFSLKNILFLFNI